MKDEKLEDQILDEVNSVNDIEDQLLKLFCLFNCCMASHVCEEREYLSREYIKEKLGRVIDKKPIPLDDSAKIMYLAIKLGRYQSQDGSPRRYHSKGV